MSIDRKLISLLTLHKEQCEFPCLTQGRNEVRHSAAQATFSRYAINSAFTFDLYEVGPIVPGLGVFYPSDEAERVLEEYYKLTRAAPDEVTTLALNGHVSNLPPIPDDVAGQEAVAIMGCYAGDIEEGETALAPFRNITDPILDMSEPMPYEMFHDLGTMMYPDGRNYCHRSVYVDDLIDLVLEKTDAAPSPMAGIGIWHMGGAISDVDSDETAYPHRGAEYMITIEANWEETDDEVNLEWARETDRAFRKDGGSGAYAGFTGVSEQENEDWISRVYADDFDRLLEVKQQYDPENIFNQNINIASVDD